MRSPEDYIEESLLIPELGDEDIEEGHDFSSLDIHATIISSIPVLVEKARTAAKYGQSFSYRGFKVGAAAIAYDTDPDNPRLSMFTAGNYKARIPEEDKDDADVADIPKQCAEMDIIVRASGHNFERVGIFVVAATTNQDRIKAVTPLAGSTLEPCDECEHLMQHIDLVDDDTMIMTIGSGDDRFQIQNFKNLARRYRRLEEDEDPGKLKMYPYSSYAWEARYRHYIERRQAAGIGASIYGRKKRAEKQCRRFALEAMTA